jgi:hypothetical protein
VPDENQPPRSSAALHSKQLSVSRGGLAASSPLLTSHSTPNQRLLTLSGGVLCDPLPSHPSPAALSAMALPPGPEPGPETESSSWLGAMLPSWLRSAPTGKLSSDFGAAPAEALLHSPAPRTHETMDVDAGFEGFDSYPGDAVIPTPQRYEHEADDQHEEQATSGAMAQLQRAIRETREEQRTTQSELFRIQAPLRGHQALLASSLQPVAAAAPTSAQHRHLPGALPLPAGPNGVQLQDALRSAREDAKMFDERLRLLMLGS